MLACLDRESTLVISYFIGHITCLDYIDTNIIANGVELLF